MIDIFFIIRFSLITPTAANSWKKAKDVDFETYILNTLNEDRLRARLFLTRSLTIPSIQEQIIPIDCNVKIQTLIVTTEILPPTITIEINKIIEQHNNIHAIYVPIDKPVFTSMIDQFVQDTARKGARLVTVRIDDDDALSLNYVKNCMPYFQFHADSFVLSFSTGYVVEHDAGRFINPRKYSFPKIALGLAYAPAIGEYKNIYSLGSHIDIDRIATCFIVHKPEMFFWTRHPFADSRGLSEHQKKNIPITEINSVIQSLEFEGSSIAKFIS